MGRRRERKPMYAIGDFVFAKVRGYRAWPARILERFGNTTYNVYFYGTCNRSKVPVIQLFEFERHLSRLGALRSRSLACNAAFRGAMLHARHAFSRPDKDFGYYQVLSVLEGDCVDAMDVPVQYKAVGSDYQCPEKRVPNELVSVVRISQDNEDKDDSDSNGPDSMGQEQGSKNQDSIHKPRNVCHITADTN
ncbi:hypothetical protein KR009_004935 [Drosophila setifemur]|nr:hypothetical protein KR009_004935 [Drosophila setifemur]